MKGLRSRPTRVVWFCWTVRVATVCVPSRFSHPNCTGEESRPCGRSRRLSGLVGYVSEYARRIEGHIIDMAQPIAARGGVEVVDVRFLPRSGRSLLRVTIDLPIEAGPQARVTVSQCAGVSRDLEHAIEAEDVIEESYLLEVSSPGIDRQLRSERDFRRNEGQKVVVQYRQQTDSQPEPIILKEGKISGYEADCLLLEHSDELLRIPVDTITSAKLDISF